MKKSLIAALLVVSMSVLVFALYDDTDGGFNPAQKGSYLSYTDYCMDSVYLLEYSCLNGSCDSYNVSCYSYNATLCQYGECVTGNNWCARSDIDRDGGVDISDFLYLKASMNVTGCGIGNSWCNETDINKDTLVDDTDFNILVGEYGSVNCSA